MCRCGIGIIASDGDSARRARVRRCGSWQHEPCATLNRKRIIAIADRGKADHHLVLTAPHEHPDGPVGLAAKMNAAFPVFMKRLARELKLPKIEYLRVFERHKDGWPHLHIILRCPKLPIYALRLDWTQLTGGFQINARFIRPGMSVARYIAKYLGKDLSQFGNLRRWAKSEGWLLPGNNEARREADRYGTYSLRTESLITWCETLAMEGWQIVWPAGSELATATAPIMIGGP